MVHLTMLELENKTLRALRKKPQTLTEIAERADVSVKRLCRPISNLVEDRRAVRHNGRPPTYSKP